jgi:hypothetical protein
MQARAKLNPFRSHWAGAILLLLSILCFYWERSIDEKYPRIISSLPIDVEEVSSVTTSFTPSISLHYFIVVRVKRAIPENVLFCLLGIDKKQEGCKGEKGLKPVWALTDGNEVIASNLKTNCPPDGWSSGVEIAKTIGAFNGIQGKSYRLVFNVNQAVPALSPANPRLEVEATPLDFEDKVTRLMLPATIPEIIFFLGFLFHTGFLVFTWIRRKRSLHERR